MVRKTNNYRMSPLDANLRERIDAGAAINCVNQMVRREIEASPALIGACKLALSKCLPDLQALAVAIQSDQPTTKQDIDAMLLAAGIDPSLAFDDNALDGQAEPVSTIEQEVIENAGN